MNSLLNLIRGDQLNDFQKTGYFLNLRTGSPKVFSEKLLPFFKPVFRFDGSTSITVNEFRLQHINKTRVCSQIDLSTSFLDLTVINGNWVVSYDGNGDIIGTIADFQGGMYRYYIEISTGRTYVSEPFWIQRNKFSTVAGDFNEDFNNDFNVYQEGVGALPY